MLKRLLPIVFVLLLAGYLSFDRILLELVAYRLGKEITFTTKECSGRTLTLGEVALIDGSIETEALIIEVAYAFPSSLNLRVLAHNPTIHALPKLTLPTSSIDWHLEILDSPLLGTISNVGGLAATLRYKNSALIISEERTYFHLVDVELAPLEHLLPWDITGGQISGEGQLRNFSPHSGSFTLKGLSVAAMRGISGECRLHPHQISLFVEGELADSTVELAGHISVSKTPSLSARLSWPEGAAIALQHTLEGAHLELSDIGPLQATFIQSLLGERYPDLSLFSLSHGTLSARMTARLDRGVITHVNVEQFNTENLAFAYAPLQLHGALAYASGSLSADVTPQHLFANVGGEIALSNSTVQFADPNADFCLSQLEGRISIRHSVLDNGELVGNCNGLYAGLRLGRMTPQGKISLTLEGPITAFAPFLPREWGEPLARDFADDTFLAESEIWKEGRELQITGVWTMRAEDGQRAAFPFGVTLQPHLSAHQGFYLRPWTRALLRMAGYAPTVLDTVHHRLVPQELCVERGWLRGSNLNAAKYVEPLLMGPDEMHITGAVDFEASFEGEIVEVEYEARNVCLEAPAFKIAVPKIGDLRPEGLDHVRAFHTFDLQSGSQSGSIPLRGATYWERKTGLIFTHAAGYVEMEDTHFDISSITTDCHGVAFAGSILLDTEMGNYTDLRIHSPTIEGPIQGAFLIMSHICPMDLWALPIDGKAFARNGGLDLHIFTSETEKVLEAMVRGGIRDGRYDNLADASFDLAYDHETQDLTLHDIDALLTLDGRTYALAGEEITCTGFPHGPATFDLALLAGPDEVGRAKGALALLCKGERSVIFDTLYLGGIDPQVTACTFTTHLTSFEATPTFELATIRRDLTWLKELHLFPSCNMLPQTLPKGTLHAEIAALEKTWNIKLHHESFDCQTTLIHGKDALDIRRLSGHLGERVAFDLSGTYLQDTLTATLHSLSLGGKYPLEIGHGNLTIGEAGLQIHTHLHGYPITFSYGEESCIEINDTLRLYVTLQEEPILNRIEGELHGMEVHLVRALDRPHDQFQLYGSINFNALEASRILPEGLQSFIRQTGAGAGYRLLGHFSAPFTNPFALSFNGHLTGRDYIFYGYRLGHLESDLTFSPEAFDVHQLSMTDQAGRIGIGNIHGHKDQNDLWQFHIPLITVHDLRPSILRRVDGVRSRPKTFTITEARIQDLFGNGNGLESWDGVGYLTFNNPPRISSVGTFFEFPEAILGKLGLDMGSFVPSTGSVTFRVADARLYLSNFDEVYSRQRRSQFFLSPEHLSCIHLDGRLDIHIRMKQNNLILKLTEAFTVGVGGTLGKPTYNLGPGAPSRRRYDNPPWM